LPGGGINFQNNQLGTIIFQEYIQKGIKIGVLKVFNHYFLISITNKVDIIFEFTEKEDIDTIQLLSSKKNSVKQTFFEIINKSIGKNNIKYRESTENQDFLKGIKEKINNLSRGHNE
jgi:hypothetical protein